MRTSIFASLALLTSVLAVASPEPCSDHPGVVHAIANETTVTVTTTTTTTTTITYEDIESTPKKNKVPKVANATVETVANGATSAIDQYANSGYIPSSVGKSLTGAITKAVNSLGGTTVTTVSGGVTQTLTAAVPVTTSAVDIAAEDIKKALDEAFAAVDLSQSGLDNSTIASLEACLETVLASGGIPAGYACLSETGSTGAGMEETLNTILEQFVGILPNVILDSVFDAVSPSLTALLPASEAALVAQIEASIKSVIATSSGDSVTALEQVQSCYTAAISQQGNTSALACYESSGAADTIQNMEKSVIEQFVGVLPASLVTSVENIVAYNVGNTTAAGGNSALASKVQTQIANAINSAGSTLSGNMVSLAEALADCTSILISTGNATAAQECIVNGSAPQLATNLVNGLAEQFKGYLPSSFFTDLVQEANTLLSDTSLTSAQIDAALDSFFNNATSYGPAYVTCLEEVEACVVASIKASGNATATCAGPSGSCGKLASTSASATPSNTIIAAIGIVNATVTSSLASSSVAASSTKISSSSLSADVASSSSSSAVATAAPSSTSKASSTSEAASTTSKSSSVASTSSDTNVWVLVGAKTSSTSAATATARIKRSPVQLRHTKRDREMMAHVRFGRVVRKSSTEA